MSGTQTRYQRLEKLMLALFIISRKLPITILTVRPLRTVVDYTESNQEDFKMGLGTEILWTQIRAKDSD